MSHIPNKYIKMSSFNITILGPSSKVHVKSVTISVRCARYPVILEKNRTISKSKKLENELIRTSNETWYFEIMQYFNIRYKILPTPFQYYSSYRLLNVVR